MNILLAYGGQETVTSSILEYFFKSCGIWVEKTKYEDNQKAHGRTLCLSILNPEEIVNYRYAGVLGHVCLVTGEILSDYCNIISQQEENSYEKVIRILLGTESELVYLNRLFEIYMKNNLWEAAWLYEEFAKENVKRWDGIITATCRRVLDSIDKEFPRQCDNMYVQYLRFYCRWIQCGAGYRTLSTRLLESKRLLEDFIPFADRYGDDEMVLHLEGRICELSAVENKQAVFFYRRAAKRGGYSDFLYDVGHSFEKVYGDDDRAILFYKKAYLKDRDNYRALYKLALKEEIENKWTDAFNTYGMIEEQLSGIVKTNREGMSAVSVKEIDYLYKTYKRLLHIYRQIFGCGVVENSYTTRIKGIEEELLHGRCFYKLAEYMQGQERREEIAEELRIKFKGECYQ